MTRHKHVIIEDRADNMSLAMGAALDIIERECIINPSVGIVPTEYCPCPDHFDDECEYAVRVEGGVAHHDHEES